MAAGVTGAVGALPQPGASRFGADVAVGRHDAARGFAKITGA